MTLFERNLPQKQQRTRERENKKKTREQKREREGGNNKKIQRVGCQMIWELQETGHHRLNFPHRFLPVLWMCTTVCFTKKNNGLSCLVPGYRFWEGPIALQCFVHISDKKNSCNTKVSKVVFNHFDRDSIIFLVGFSVTCLNQPAVGDPHSELLPVSIAVAPSCSSEPWPNTPSKKILIKLQ